MQETEVYRICKFEPDACYAYALYTRHEGKWPNERYYVKSKNLVFLGRHLKSERWGAGDGSGGSETFIDDITGKISTIEYDYEGKTCFCKVICV